MEYRELYEWGVCQLCGAGIAESSLDARLLLEEVCGTDRNDLLVCLLYTSDAADD